MKVWWRLDYGLASLSKRKSTLFSNYSCIIIHGHVQIKQLLHLMDGLNVHYIAPLWVLQNCSLIWIYKDNINGSSVTNYLALVATLGAEPPHPQTPRMNTPTQAQPCVVHPQSTNILPTLGSKSEILRREPNSARVSRPLVHRSWLPSPPCRCLPHLHMNHTSWPSADPQLGMRWIHGCGWNLYAHQLLPSNQPNAIPFLGDGRCSAISNAKCAQIEGASK